MFSLKYLGFFVALWKVCVFRPLLCFCVRQFFQLTVWPPLFPVCLGSVYAVAVSLSAEILPSACNFLNLLNPGLFLRFLQYFFSSVDSRV